MSQKTVPDAEFIELLETKGPAQTAKILGIGERGVYSRRRRIEKLIKRPLAIPTPTNGPGSPTAKLKEHAARLEVEITDGVVLIGSDSHYWPGIISTAHRAFVKLNKELKPKFVIKNGDELDFPRISRHAPIQWEDQPTVIQEIETAQDRLHEITEANKNAKYFWPLGNHDARYETKLATVAPEYASVKGVHLKDHFPRWKPCWSVWINGNIVVKHRWASGVHAAYNNVMKGGKTIITGHTHALEAKPWSDYCGTRWGVQCGTMADPYGPQFEGYMEDNSRNWISGFVVLTIHKGKLLWPDVVHVTDEDDGEFSFQGKLYRV